MIAVVQRVLSASVTVTDPTYRSSIEQGLLILLGVETTDDQASADWMAGKLAKLQVLRIHENQHPALKKLDGEYTSMGLVVR